jgi:hypothetical protein
MINFKKAFSFDKLFFTTLGKNVAKAHKRSIFKKGLDHAGNTFEDYTPAYKKQKQALGKYTGKVDLTLSGNMKNAFQFIDADKTGFSYGIEGDESKDKTMAQRMDFQGPRKKTRKRFTTTKTNPTPPAQQEMIGKEMAKQVVRSFTKELRKNGMGYKVYTI